MNIAMTYIETIDDEQFLTYMVLEKDYTNRDILQIAVQYELLDLIQSPKIEAIILKIWNSDYDTSGSIFEMSTSYQISMNEDLTKDIEYKNRFLNNRDISQQPQSRWIY